MCCSLINFVVKKLSIDFLSILSCFHCLTLNLIQLHLNCLISSYQIKLECKTLVNSHFKGGVATSFCSWTSLPQPVKCVVSSKIQLLLLLHKMFQLRTFDIKANNLEEKPKQGLETSWRIMLERFWRHWISNKFHIKNVDKVWRVLLSLPFRGWGRSQLQTRVYK